MKKKLIVLTICVVVVILFVVALFAFYPDLYHALPWPTGNGEG